MDEFLGPVMMAVLFGVCVAWLLVKGETNE